MIQVKVQSGINRFLIIAVVLWSFPSLAGEGGDAKSHQHMMQHSGHQHQSMSSGAPSGMSIYSLDSKWTDQNGKAKTLSELRGRNKIVAMVYTSCTTACPLIVSDMKSVRAQLNAQEKEKVDMTIFSYDSTRDTPEVMTKFAKKMKIDNKSWTLMSSDDGSVAELAAALGVQYKKLDSGDFIHSNTIFFLNSEGEIVAQKEGLKTPSQKFVEQIRTHLKGTTN